MCHQFYKTAEMSAKEFLSRKNSKISIATSSQIDIHLSILPNEKWNLNNNCASQKSLEEAITIGFIRVHNLSSISELRTEIENQLTLNHEYRPATAGPADQNDKPKRQINNVKIPKSYIFLKSVGRALVAVRPKQEELLTVEHFLAESLHPEVIIMDVKIKNSPGLKRENTKIMQELAKEVKEIQEATGTVPEPSTAQHSFVRQNSKAISVNSKSPKKQPTQEHLFDDQNYAEKLRDAVNQNVMDRLTNIDGEIVKISEILSNLGHASKAAVENAKNNSKNSDIESLRSNMEEQLIKLREEVMKQRALEETRSENAINDVPQTPSMAPSRNGLPITPRQNVILDAHTTQNDKNNYGLVRSENGKVPIVGINYRNSLDNGTWFKYFNNRNSLRNANGLPDNFTTSLRSSVFDRK